MNEVQEEKGVLERKDAELCDIAEHLMAFNNQLRADQLALKNERETLNDLYRRLIGFLNTYLLSREPL